MFALFINTTYLGISMYIQIVLFNFPNYFLTANKKVRVAKIGKGIPSTSELYRRKLNTKSSLMDDLFLRYIFALSLKSI